MTTIEISDNAAIVWRFWKKTFSIGSVELMDKIMVECKIKHQRQLYLSLPDPLSIKVMPLSGVKIQKKYR
jgi:hypothetical protein